MRKAIRFREKLGCPDALYQADGCGQVVRCLSLAFAFSADVLDVSDTSVYFNVEGVLNADPRYQTIRLPGLMRLSA